MLNFKSQCIILISSYYPLYPPADDVNVDYELWEVHARLPVTPHVLILPSDLKAFVKVIYFWLLISTCYTFKLGLEFSVVNPH